jgi:hypothetical protein
VSEWWTDWLSYRPSDFLMFSPRLYWRLFEGLNRDAWPLALLLAMCITAGAWRAARRGAVRLLTAALALAWLAVALLFLRERYAPINWAIEWIWPLFVLQGLLLALLAAKAMPITPRPGRPGGAARVLLVWALLLHPLLPLPDGRPLQQAELPGLAPEPTVLLTLALLLAYRQAPPLAHLLWPLPLAWCAFSAATLATLGSRQALVPAAALLLVTWALLPSRGKPIDTNAS